MSCLRSSTDQSLRNEKLSGLEERQRVFLAQGEHSPGRLHCAKTAAHGAENEGPPSLWDVGNFTAVFLQQSLFSLIYNSCQQSLEDPPQTRSELRTGKPSSTLKSGR